MISKHGDLFARFHTIPENSDKTSSAIARRAHRSGGASRRRTSGEAGEGTSDVKLVHLFLVDSRDAKLPSWQ
jgi:hypothetical protein